MGNLKSKYTQFIAKITGHSTSIILFVLFVLIFFFSITSDSFLTYNNFFNLFRSTSINGVIAVGMTFVILTGGIDLSVGAVVGLAGVLSTLAIKGGIPIPIAITLALISSVFIGIINGLVIHYGKVPPFIATLGSMTIVRGLVKLISDAKMITGLDDNFKSFAINKFLSLPNLFWVWFFVILISIFILSKTIFGRNIYAIGSNLEAARMSGINIPINIIGVYSVSSLLSGIAGIMLATRLASGVPLAGIGYELDAIASTVVGGTSLLGAQGGVMGTVIGSFLIATIRNGGVLIGLNPFILEILVGLLIVIAVIMQRKRS